MLQSQTTYAIKVANADPDLAPEPIPTVSYDNIEQVLTNETTYLPPATLSYSYAPIQTTDSVNKEIPINTEGFFTRIIKKEDRSNDEAWALYEHLKDYKFFNLFMSMTNEMHQQDWLIHIFKRLKYEHFTAGQLIFEEGEPSNGKMYVVLSGELLVMVKKLEGCVEPNIDAAKKLWDSKSIRIKSSRLITQNKSVLEPEAMTIEERIAALKRGSRKSGIYGPKAATLKVKRSLVPGDSGTNLESLSANVDGTDLDQEKKNTKKMYGFIKDTIGKGGYFGEKALEANNLRRSASIIAETDCDLLVLTKDEFDLIKKTFTHKTRFLMNFLMDNLPGLSKNQGKVLVQNFMYLFEEKTFSYKNHLFHEGEAGENFYLIYSGTCEVYRTVVVEEPQIQFSDHLTRRPSLIQSRKTKEKIPLVVTKGGYLVGEEVLYMDQPCYSYSVQVTSDACKALCVNKSRFAFYFKKETLNKMQEVYEEKKNHKEEILIEQLANRGLEIVEKDANSLLISCKRKPPQTPATKELKPNSTYQSGFRKSETLQGEKFKQEGFLSNYDNKNKGEPSTQKVWKLKQQESLVSTDSGPNSERLFMIKDFQKVNNKHNRPNDYRINTLKSYNSSSKSHRRQETDLNIMEEMYLGSSGRTMKSSVFKTDVSAFADSTPNLINLDTQRSIEELKLYASCLPSLQGNTTRRDGIAPSLESAVFSREPVPLSRNTSILRAGLTQTRTLSLAINSISRFEDVGTSDERKKSTMTSLNSEQTFTPKYLDKKRSTTKPSFFSPKSEIRLKEGELPLTRTEFFSGTLKQVSLKKKSKPGFLKNLTEYQKNRFEKVKRLMKKYEEGEMAKKEDGPLAETPPKQSWKRGDIQAKSFSLKGVTLEECFFSGFKN